MVNNKLNIGNSKMQNSSSVNEAMGKLTYIHEVSVNSTCVREMMITPPTYTPRARFKTSPVSSLKFEKLKLICFDFSRLASLCGLQAYFVAQSSYTIVRSYIKQGKSYFNSVCLRLKSLSYNISLV